MDQVDFAKIISAAAGSTLGVLSLIIVAVGVLAFYFFKGSGDRVKLAVWLTMLLAAVMFAAAVVNQRPPQRDDGPKPGPAPTPDAAPSVAPTALPTPAQTATPMPTPTAAPTREADDRVSDLSGQWHDNDGYLYDIQVNGAVLAYQQRLNGQYAGYGRGTISGRSLEYRYVSAQAGQGECRGIVAGDGQSISGTCNADGGGSWAFMVER